MSLALTPGLPAVLFYFAYALWLGSELVGAVLIPRLRPCRKAEVKRDRGSAILISLSVFVSISVAFNYGILNIGPLPDWVFYPGIQVMILGVVIRQYAFAVLGRFFSLTARVAEGHRVVDKGLYHLVRDTSCTGVMLTFIGLGLAVQSWPATLILLLVFALAYGYRMLVEEKILTTQLGQEYVDYMRRTKRLIPFLI